MKLRFLMIVGVTAARAELVQRAGLAGAAGLVRRATGETFELWSSEDTPVLPGDGNRAVAVGLVLDRSDARRLTVAAPVFATPADLARQYWGCFALFAETPRGHLAYRDPSGSVTVYHRQEQDCEVYASDDDLLWFGAERPPLPDLGYIRHWLSFPYLRSARTGCLGATELLPGQCRTVDRTRVSMDQLWAPGSGAAQPKIRDFEEAAALLRSELLRTIPQMVPDDGRIMLKLSGGLDSSLVAAALAQAGKRFTAITFATRDAEGDERVYARQVASACGVELLEIEEEACSIDLMQAPVSRLRPPRQPLLQGLDRSYAVRWAALGADAIVDGVGGDNVFAYLNTAAPVLDAWACGGPRSAWRSLNDLALLHAATLWMAAGFARRKARRGTSTRWPAMADFLLTEAVAPEPERHPWLDLPATCLPGLREHVRMIVGVHHFVPDPAPGLPAVLHPLLAQPILELCLRIPSHLWICGGRDRAVARAAFADLLPGAVLRRRGKGALGGMFRAQFSALAPQLAPFLGNGRLADAGIIDREAIASYLNDPGRWAGYQAMRLLEIAAAEQWLRSFD